MSSNQEQKPDEDWKIFRGNSDPHDGITRLPPPPTWRNFEQTENLEKECVDVDTLENNDKRGKTFQIPKDDEGKEGEKLLNLVNAAIYLRRPLLVEGNPGTGKTSIAYAIAYELKLGSVLSWPINSRSTLKDGLYQYDAIARLQDAQAQQFQNNNLLKGELKQVEPISIGRYFTLGPLGTAFLPFKKPRVLLIDEIDKSDINLPNDLLNLFEEGEYKIPELVRFARFNDGQSNPEQKSVVEVQTHDNSTAKITNGKVRCYEFPITILTSNGERDFPPAFLRRCLRITLENPEKDTLIAIVNAYLEQDTKQDQIQELVNEFIARRETGKVATDQLLNVVYLLARQFAIAETDKKTLLDQLLQSLE